MWETPRSRGLDWTESTLDPPPTVAEAVPWFQTGSTPAEPRCHRRDVHRQSRQSRLPCRIPSLPYQHVVETQAQMVPPAPCSPEVGSCGGRDSSTRRPEGSRQPRPPEMQLELQPKRLTLLKAEPSSGRRGSYSPSLQEETSPLSGQGERPPGQQAAMMVFSQSPGWPPLALTPEG